jgi:uncharacterized protein YeaO (DUF488 family)
VAAVQVKRATEAPSPADGMRVLVDRRWPPGVGKEAIAVDLWLKEAAPSEALRRWYGSDASRWDGFTERYRAEVESRDGVLRLLRELRRRGPVTLLHAGRDGSHSNAAALKRIIEAESAAAPGEHP